MSSGGKRRRHACAKFQPWEADFIRGLHRARVPYKEIAIHFPATRTLLVRVVHRQGAYA
jgi:hypothetical protein